MVHRKAKHCFLRILGNYEIYFFVKTKTNLPNCIKLAVLIKTDLFETKHLSQCTRGSFATAYPKLYVLLNDLTEHAGLIKEQDLLISSK